MDLDNIKDLWQKEAVATPEISLEKQKEIRMPLEKIRKNMKMEFWANGISMLLLIPLSSVFSENPFLRWSFMLLYFFIIGYYSIRFYGYYKIINHANLSTFEKILVIRYETKNYMELYKSYYIASVPVFYILLLFFLQKKDFFSFPDLIMHYSPFIVFFGFVAVLLGFGKWWWDKFYKKYLTEIDDIFKQLK